MATDAHHYGRNELCQALRELIEAGGKHTPAAMWTPTPQRQVPGEPAASNQSEDVMDEEGQCLLLGKNQYSITSDIEPTNVIDFLQSEIEQDAIRNDVAKWENAVSEFSLRNSLKTFFREAGIGTCLGPEKQRPMA